MYMYRCNVDSCCFMPIPLFTILNGTSVLFRKIYRFNDRLKTPGSFKLFGKKISILSTQLDLNWNRFRIIGRLISALYNFNPLTKE